MAGNLHHQNVGIRNTQSKSAKEREGRGREVSCQVAAKRSQEDWIDLTELNFIA